MLRSAFPQFGPAGARLRAILLANLALAAGLCLAGCSVPDVGQLKSGYPTVRYRGRQLPPEIKIQKSLPAEWTFLPAVSKAAVGAIIVSEDWAFYQHKGFDSNQIREAIEEDIEKGRFARGASTITQQVAKNVFLESDKNLLRKVKELILAVRLEKTLRKNKILEIYLNIAEWGEGLFGIRAASRFYFGKPPSQLTAREGAFLAMLLPSPKRYSQSFRDKKLTSYARKTMTSILEKMEQAGYLTEEALTAAREQALPFETVPGATSPDSELEPPAPADE